MWLRASGSVCYTAWLWFTDCAQAFVLNWESLGSPQKETSSSVLPKRSKPKGIQSSCDKSSVTDSRGLFLPLLFSLSIASFDGTLASHVRVHSLFYCIVKKLQSLNYSQNVVGWKYIGYPLILYESTSFAKGTWASSDVNINIYMARYTLIFHEQ